MVFVNCSSSLSTCTDPGRTISGASGICDTETEICICPSTQFSGVDLLTIANDCHINMESRKAMEAITLVSTIIAYIFILIGVQRLLASWKAVFVWGFFPRFVFPPPLTLSYQKLALEKRKRRLYILIHISCGFYLTCAFAFLIMSLSNPVGSVLDRPSPFGMFLLASQITFIIIALYLVLFAWYDSLPSFRLFESMFPEIRGYLLVRRPAFIGVFIVVNSGLTIILSYSVIFLFALLNPNLIESDVIPWSLTLFGIELTIYFIVLGAVCALLLRLLTVFSDETFTKGTADRPGLLNTESRARFKEARHTVLVMFCACIIFTPLCLTLCFVMAWNDFAHRNFYFFVSLLQACGAGFTIFIVYLFSFRLHYATPKENDQVNLIDSPPMPKKSFDMSLTVDMSTTNPVYNQMKGKTSNA